MAIGILKVNLVLHYDFVDSLWFLQQQKKIDYSIFHSWNLGEDGC